MSTDLSEAAFASGAHEPLGFSLRRHPPEGSSDPLRVHSFEFTSRGDRVPGRLQLPETGAGPFPLILLAHGAGSSKNAPDQEAVAARWVDGGAAVASIDLPLHGERESAKLSALLLEAQRNPSALNDLGEALWVDFTRQAVVDLRRSVDALATLREIDSERLAFAGFELGASVGAIFCAFDSRPRAAVLALPGAGSGPACVDPLSFIDRCSGLSLLFVGGGEVTSRGATQALFDAAPPPKEILWLEAGDTQGSESAPQEMSEFLQHHLAMTKQQ